MKAHKTFGNVLGVPGGRSLVQDSVVLCHGYGGPAEADSPKKELPLSAQDKQRLESLPCLFISGTGRREPRKEVGQVLCFMGKRCVRLFLKPPFGHKSEGCTAPF